MSRKGIKVLGLSIVVVVLAGVISSCKGAHELCPAYTKADSQRVSQDS